MKKRILSLFLAFSLAAGMGAVAAGNTSEAANLGPIWMNGVKWDVSTGNNGEFIVDFTPEMMVNSQTGVVAQIGTLSRDAVSGNIDIPAQFDGIPAGGAVVSGWAGFAAGAGGTGLASGSGLRVRSNGGDNSVLNVYSENEGYVAGGAVNLPAGSHEMGAAEAATMSAIWAGTKSIGGAAGANKDLKIRMNVPNGVFLSAGSLAAANAIRPTGDGFTTGANGNWAFKATNRAGEQVALPYGGRLVGNVQTGKYLLGYAPAGGTYTYADVVKSVAANNQIMHPVSIAATDVDILFDYTEVQGLNVSVVGSGNVIDGTNGYAKWDSVGTSVTAPNIYVNASLSNDYVWQEVEVSNAYVGGRNVEPGTTIDGGTALRVFKAINRQAPGPIANPGQDSTISGTGRYGETLKCTDAYSKNSDYTYFWYRGVFNKTDSNTAGPRHGAVLLREATGTGANELVLTDVYRNVAGHADFIRDRYVADMEWDFTVDRNNPQTGLLNDNEEYRVWCVVQRTGTNMYSTRNAKVERTILDRTDFVYGTNQESYAQWKPGAGDNLSDVIDPVFRNANGGDIPIALRNGLSSAGYHFEIRYRDVDQAKEVDAGNVTAAKNTQQAASNYYVDGTLERDLNGVMTVNRTAADRDGRLGYGYNFLTGEQLRESGQVGSYEVYVVGIYQDVNHVSPAFTENGYTTGVNGQVIAAGGGEALDTTTTPNTGNMARRNQNNFTANVGANNVTLPNGTRIDTRIDYQDTRWGYALKDDDSAETLGNKLGKNVPALYIGTLNVQKTKWPTNAALGVAPDNNSLPGSENQTGYLVDNTFDITTVNIPERWAQLDTYEWFRVDDSGNWESTGKTGRTYTAGAADVGYYLGVRASNNNYEGTIEGKTQAKIAKRELTKTFTEGNLNREVHFTNGGKATVDLRSLLGQFGDALGDVTMELKQNVSGEGTIEKAVYSASNKNLEYTFKSFDSVPTSFAPYTISGQIEFPGHIINLRGDVRGTTADVAKVVIEPIETKEYDGVGVSTTAKVYINEVEVTEGSNVAIRYVGKEGTNYNDVAGPSNRGKYEAQASWTTNGKTVTATCDFEIKRRKLTDNNSIARDYNVGANVPSNLGGYFNLIQKDNIVVHNFVTKYNINSAGVNGRAGTGLVWDTARDTGAAGNAQRYVNTGVLNKVFYTPTMDIGGNFWLQFELSGTDDALDNYTKPDAIAIKVGTGYVNASTSNTSTNEPYAEQVARVNRLWKEGCVHRMVLAGGGDYLYTSSKKEALYNVRTGEWTFDDVLFKGVAQGTAGAKELVRLDNKGQRVTTIKDSKEYNYLTQRGYVDNGLIAYVYETKVEGAIAYNRLYYPKTGTHMLQNPDNNEFKVLIEGGAWQDEGTQFYAIQP